MLFDLRKFFYTFGWPAHSLWDASHLCFAPDKKFNQRCLLNISILLGYVSICLCSHEFANNLDFVLTSVYRRIFFCLHQCIVGNDWHATSKCVCSSEPDTIFKVNDKYWMLAASSFCDLFCLTRDILGLPWMKLPGFSCSSSLLTWADKSNFEKGKFIDPTFPVPASVYK